MKIYISADIEGTAATVNWPETTPREPDYPYHCAEMTREVVSACKAAIEMGADEILIKDAHGTATNLDVTKLPECAKIIRGWEGHPYMMVQGIDSSFDAVMFIGYHSEAGSPGNPLSHTMTKRTQHVRMNGEYLSEFQLYSMCAALEGVPTVFLSGDKALCEKSRERYPWLETVAVKEGVGDSVICQSPERVQKLIYEGVKKALSGNPAETPVAEIPSHFEVELEYKEHAEAARMGYFPGVTRVGSHTVRFESDDFFEVARTLKFIL
ncbi:MAG: M55 family metallopeptidase [Candidatus Limivivens sp.]|nr:M55 family metallopeptidase [Candidatus Limivivens sp.]